MRNDHKKEQPRKERSHHQPGSISYNKKVEPEELPEASRGSRIKKGPERDIKGMDIDLMNYTDI